MKILTRSLLLIAVLLSTNLSYSQKAKDGDYVVGTANSVINTYTYITGANPVAGQTSITVNNNSMTGGVFGGALAPGDLIMIIQMQGASINCNTTPVTDWGNAYTVPNPYLWTFDWYNHIEDWGSVLAPYGAYNNAGKFEQVEVLSVSGVNTINLQCGLLNNYTTAGHIQVIRVPRFNNLTVSGGASIVPSLWNGTTGGVVAIEVEATLDINAGASITASNRGFRGGQVDNTFTPGIGSTANPAEVRFLGTNDATQGSEKGEGIAGFTTEYNAIFSRYGISAAANAGGGGGPQNAGGGGGSNIYTGVTAYTGNGIPPGYVATWNLDLSAPPLATPGPIGGTVTPGGGRGGYAISTASLNPSTNGPRLAAWNGDARKTNGGRGGHPLAYDATRLFFGGGGGAGDQDSGQGGSGGRGGGIVYITSYGNITGSGSIDANGEAGQNSNPNNQPLGFSAYKGNDGAGGGGAGGSIYIENANAIAGTISLNARGGNGGNQNLQVNIAQPNEAGGPGGSGAGGSIAYNVGGAIENVTAGTGGTTTSTQMTNFPPNGATAGHAGVGGLPTKYYDLTSNDVTICAGQTANLVVNVLGTLPVGGTLEWYTQPFGGTPIVGQTGMLTYNPSPAVTTTYYVGVCPGTFRIPITVTVNAGPNLIITDPLAVCSPSTVDITLPAVTAGSDPGTLTYWTDAGATISYGTPTTATNGTYYIQLDIGGGCTAVQPVNVTVNPQDDASFTTTPTCDGGTSTITGTPGGTFAFNPAPGDGAIIDGSGTVTLGTTGTTYFIEYTTTGACPASSIVSVTAATDLAYTPTITDENCGAGDGIIDLVASGGDGGPYQYSITGGAPYSGSGTFGSLSAGSYSISILDNSGCEITGTESVGGTGGPSIDNVLVTDPSCAGACDGSITVTVSGGTPPYSYQWYDDLSNPIGTDSPTLSGQCAGDYSVEVSDASGGMAVFFTEDYGTGCSQGNLANGTVTANGTWTTTLTGFNGGGANNWFISATESGMGAGNCGDGCLGTGTNNRTLHVANVANGTGACFFCPTGDCGAAYADGTTDFGFCAGSMDPTMNARAESPTIDCSGQSSITLDFEYITGGQPGVDFCTIEYFDGTIWSSLVVPAPTAMCGGQGLWTASSVALPASADNNPNVKIGFRWQQIVDDGGADPSFAVDNVTLTSLSSACPAIAFATLTDPPAPNLVVTDPTAICAPGTTDITLPAVTAGSDAGTLTYWDDAGATISQATPTSVGTGTYYIQLDVAGCTVIQPVNVVVNPQPNLVITDPLAVCAPSTIDITAPSVTAGSDAGTLTYWNDAGATVSQGTPGAVGNGTYYIQLEDGNFCSSIAAVNAVVNPAPNLIITDPPAACAPATVDITLATVTAGSDAGTLSYWDDAGATISQATPTAISVTGTYYIQLVDANTCSIIQPVNVVVTAAPNLIITNPAAVCAPSLVDLTAPAVTAGSDAGTLTYWDDAGATINQATPTAVNTGTYYIQLDLGGGCTTIQPVNALVNPTPTIGGDIDFCVGTSSQLTGSGTPDVSTPWSTADPFIATVDNTGLVTGVAAGMVDITYLESNGCSATVTVTIFPTCVITASGINPSGCGVSDGQITVDGWPGTGTVTWVGPPSGSANNQSLPYFITGLPAGFYTISYVDDVTGCGSNSPVVQLIDGSAPNVVITNPPAVCSPNTVDLTDPAVTAGSDPGTITYWQDALATIPLASPNAISTSGTYYIQIDNGSCSSGGVPVTVVVNGLPNLVVTDPAGVCAPSLIDLTAAGVTAGSDAGTLTYWDDAAATISQGSPTAVGTGTYYIQLEDGNTCTSIQAVNAIVNNTPNLVITDPAGVCSPGTVDLTAAGVTAGSDAGSLTYWDDAGATISQATPATVGGGTYYIQLVDANSCSTIQAVVATINPTPNLVVTDPVGVCSPGTIDLTAAAVTAGSDAGTLSYWDDAGATISQATPTAVSTGTYYIQLVDANSCSTIQPVDATVNPLPNLVITDPSAVCAPGTVDITAAIITAGSDAGTLTYWDDASATVSQGTPSAIATTGTYYIQLVDANSCSVIQPVNVVVTSNPNLVITDPSPVCSPNSVDITLPAVTVGSDIGTLSYWDDAGATISQATPTAVGNGTYYIQLDIGGGCSTIQPVVVTVNPLPNLLVTDPSAVCAPGTVDLTAGAVTAGSDVGTLTYWDDALATISQGNPTAVGTGTYYIQLTDVNSCSVIQQVNAIVNQQPNLVITDPAAVCSPGTVDITAAAVTAGSDAGTLSYWDDAAATISQATPSTIGTSGTYYIQLVDANTCSTVQAVNVVVTSNPNLVITDPSPVCDPNTVDITLPAVTAGSDIGTLTYWDDAGATITQATPGALGTGTYYIQLDIGGGCTVVQPVNVVVNSLPNLVVTDPAAVCAPNTVDITDLAVTAGSDAGALTYWSDAGATTSLSTPTTVGTGTYYIQLEDANMCSVVLPVNATVNPIDDASFTATPTCDGAIVAIQGTIGGTFTFGVAPADAAVIDAVTGDVTNGSMNTQYSIQYTTNGGCPASSTQLVTSLDCTVAEDLIVPTAFTPDNDGVNDSWEILGLDARYPNNIVRVYNRWGALVFEHEANITQPYGSNMWDGKFNGQELPVSSFYYIIEFNDGSDQTLKGTVTIVKL